VNDKYISIAAFESVTARMERTIRRLWVLALVLIGLLLATNAGWLAYESQFEEITITQEAEADGNASATVNGGNAGATIYGGEGETDD
jgi:hypothetical protein